MTSTTPPPTGTTTHPAEEKSIKSLRSLISLLALGAWVSVLLDLYLIYALFFYRFPTLQLANALFSFLATGLLFWCVRLLTQRNRLAFRVYAALVASGLCYGVLLRFFITQQVSISWFDIFSLFIPGVILLELYRLQRIGILH